MIFRKFLTEVWQGQKFEIGDFISFLESIGADSIAEILEGVSQKVIPVNKAEKMLFEEAKKCAQVQ